jgi:hypothetical protein
MLVPKSRRPSSSGSRNKPSRDKPTKSFKLGVPYGALKKFLARSLERDDSDAAIRAAYAVAREHDDIDYGPAISAVHDLAGWAFDIAERDVRGWPEAERRVRNARRFVLAGIRGYRARRVPYEDVMFTAGLLVRIFDDDLSLGLSEMVSIFDALGLPTEVVPLVPRNASADLHVDCGAAYTSFSIWCTSNGLHAQSNLTFGRDMKAAGYERRRFSVGDQRPWHYVGLRAKS